MHAVNSLRNKCMFLVKLYVKAWLECSLAACAPLNDLLFIKNLNMQKYLLKKNLASLLTFLLVLIFNPILTYLWPITPCKVHHRDVFYSDSNLKFSDTGHMHRAEYVASILSKEYKHIATIISKVFLPNFSTKKLRV